MKKRFLYSLLFLFMANNAFGWGGITHKKITEYSWQKSDKLGKLTFLLRLNLDKGMLDERLSDEREEKSPDEWLQYGAEHEDDHDYPLIFDRSNFHFHNPLKEWSDAGLNDIATGSSSILWAQNGLLQAATNHNQGDRSWNKAREYYYKALIEVEYPSWRRYFIAEMFKILGHQVHLLQDMAVPDHVRNDAHVLNGAPDWTMSHIKNNSFRCIEGWADYFIEEVENLANNTQLKPSVDFSLPIDPQSPVPIAFLSDTRQYKTSQSPSARLDQGLAEYTNANFFSEDTVFTEDYQHDHKHWFPHPAKTETNAMSLGMPSSVTAKDGKKDWIKFVEKTDGEHLDRLVSAGYYQNQIDKLLGIYKFSFFLSDECHEEYTLKLIPRTVGYSAALLDYFFRGEIEVTLPESDGIYSFCFVPAEGFNKISLMVKNITSDNEEMINGQVSLVLSYRLGSSTPFVPNPPIPDVERISRKIDYINPDPNITKIDIPRDTPIRLDFDLISPLPTDAVDVTLTIVFKGDLGAELTDAVAIGFKDISEPTPIDLFNNTDWVCQDGMYVDYNNPYLIQQVDTNHNGVIDCDQGEINIIPSKIIPQFLSFNNKTASATNYYYKFPESNPVVILPGQSHRFYFLADDNPAITRCSVKVKAENIDNSSIPSAGVCYSVYSNDVSDANSYFNKLQWFAVQNKYTNTHSWIGSFRNLYFLNLIYYENVSVPENSECSLSSLCSTQTISDSTENRDTNKVYGHKIDHKAKSIK
jgi:hypothetical protein